MPHPGPYRWPRQQKLKIAIIVDGRTAAEIAEAAGISAVHLSAVVTGRSRLTPNMSARLATALGRPEHDLFADVDAAVPA
jgi:plasmid maintenance system antidote protein VapI